MSEKILIVDDDPLICEGLAYALQDKYEVFTASSGKEALKMIEQKSFDIVLTDLVMPGINGLQVLKEIKKLDSNTKVIMITAYPTVNSAVEAMKSGASDYIYKPFELSRVQKAIERALKETAFEKKSKTIQQEIDHEITKVDISKGSILKTLANPIRRNTLELLAARNYSFTEILRRLEIEDPTKLSFHLRTLKSIKLVKQDENKIYSLTKEGSEIIKLLLYLEKISSDKD